MKDTYPRSQHLGLLRVNTKKRKTSGVNTNHWEKIKRNLIHHQNNLSPKEYNTILI